MLLIVSLLNQLKTFGWFSRLTKCIYHERYLNAREIQTNICVNLCHSAITGNHIRNPVSHQSLGVAGKFNSNRVPQLVQFTTKQWFYDI
jgi:hypothetical protein